MLNNIVTLKSGS